MSVARSGVFIFAAKRTPFAGFGGKLKNISATDLSVHASKAAIASSKFDPSIIDECIIGNVINSSLDAIYISRHVALKSGAPEKTPSLTINRLCGSGFEAACLGSEAIIDGRASVVLTGGSENMSQSPMVIDGVSARWGTALGKGLNAQDSLWAGLTDAHVKMPMAMTAEKLATQYSISRADCDDYALRSQNLWQKAHLAGVFAKEIAPIEVMGKKGPEIFDTDEHPRQNMQLADLTKLKPVFKENGVVTAGNASGINDGAASLLLANESSLKTHDLKPLARMVAWARVGCDPSIMGIGPVEAIKAALKAAGLALKDMDLVEINEAFAAQYLACEKELGLDREKANLNGGAIAIGHPLGTSGARILAHLTHELIRVNKRYAIGSACIGGGQGIAVIIENVHRT